MNKRKALILITCTSAMLAILATQLVAANDYGYSVFANENKVQAQYTINSWQLSRRIGKFSKWDETYDGFIFTPKKGRSDIQLVVLAHAHSQGNQIDEELIYSSFDTCVQLSSDRGYTYEYNEEDHKYYYRYEENLGEDGGLAFFLGQMEVYLCTNFDENSDTSDFYDQLDNFTNYSVSFTSWFSYSCMTQPNETDYTVFYLVDNEDTRTFDAEHVSIEGPLCTDSTAYLQRCVGIQVDYSTISLTYSCEY